MTRASNQSSDSLMGRSPNSIRDRAEWVRASLDQFADQAGLFTDQRMIRRIGREALPLLGAGRTVLLQLSHPLIAAGVADHSDFQTDPLERLYGTLELMHTLVFGERDQVEKGLMKFHHVHRQINGRIGRAVGPYTEQTAYTGDDPDLKLWVYATLVDSSLISYQRFVRPLTPPERREYFEDTLVLARMLGIPESILPADLGSFQRYVHSTLKSSALTVTETARELAWHVLDPDVRGLQYASARLLRFVTAGLLPPRIRDGFRLDWDPRRQALLDAISRTTRFLRPIAPGWLWKSPQLAGESFLRMLLWPTR